MKILSTILIVIGFLISGVCSLMIFYATHVAISATQNSETSGIGDVVWGLSSAYLFSLINLAGFAILGVGVLLLIIGLFTGRKQQI